MVTALKQSDAIDVRRERKGAVSDVVEDSTAGFSLLQELFGVTLEPGLKDHHVRYYELGLQWYAAGASAHAGGEFVLRELVDAIMSGPPDAGSVRDDEEIELFKELRVIDYLPDSGETAFAAVRLVGGAIAPRTWVFWFPHGAFELELDYPGYLEALLLTRGLYGWQFLYADVRLAEPEYAPLVDLIRTGLDFLTEALPDPRYAELETRLAERLR
ncbi:hypothetical protein [Streptomyces rubellomurinus]|uniref:Uncharacterized protein n=1 Tax=Streptomyces rubellomurinus (strain ATCC 31215) TaxID=359131 RepID=A0A0F2TJL3_STRR3|nr:hypothetical protein [Streptomyces rubellomurinus]KJS61922.1 hypothetical protein VM95_12250 [Streptomyces rubellomurinus]